MKQFSSTLALTLLALTGCAAPLPTGSAPLAPGSAAATPGQSPAARHLAMAPGEAADQTAFVVRFKAGHDRSTLERGGFLRHLGMARTHLFTAPDADARASILAQLKGDPDVELAEPDYRMQALMAPNDPAIGRQWAVPKLQLPQAWDLTQGDPAIAVAVVDTGVNYNHPDLAGQVIKGHNFIANSDDPMDDEGHGTHCAGVIAAGTNNGTGVAGIAGKCRILAVKVLGADGSGSTSTIAEGITYATQHGAKVISLSLGGPQSSQLLASAIQAAVAAGVVVVAAAGNDSAATPNYPAAFPGVISVAASDENDGKAFFSNFASTVAVAAPGTHIYSTFQGDYKSLDGTSMAAPQVAGVAALVRSLHPDWQSSQVRAAIVGSGDPVTGFDTNPGLRRLNALKALQWQGGGAAPATSSAPLPPTPSSPSASPVPAPTAAPNRPAPVTRPHAPAPIRHHGKQPASR